MPPATYIDADYYYSWTGGQQPSNADPRIDAVLEMASRIWDRLHGVAPGMMAPIGSTAFTFDGRGGSILQLRDANGMQFFLRTITSNSCKIDDDADGSFDDYTLDLSDAWLRALPQNASSFSEPYTRLELLNISSATITQWPSAPDSVEITGTWGWASTPMGVQARVADIAHALSQRGYAGGYGTEEVLQGGVPAWVMKMTDSAYDYTRIKSA